MRKEIHQSKCEEWEKLIDQWIGSGPHRNPWVTGSAGPLTTSIPGESFDLGSFL